MSGAPISSWENMDHAVYKYAEFLSQDAAGSFDKTLHLRRPIVSAGYPPN